MIIIMMITLFQEVNVFVTSACLTYGPQFTLGKSSNRSVRTFKILAKVNKFLKKKTFFLCLWYNTLGRIC